MMDVGGVPRAIETMQGTAHRLHVSMRRLRALVEDTPLASAQTVPLGRSIGTYRLWPSIGVALLRQFLTPTPWYVREWCAAVEDVLASPAWLQATRSVAQVRIDRDVRGQEARQRVDAALASATLRLAMENLHHESLHVLDRRGLGAMVEIDTMIVDRIDDENNAVILLGEGQQPYVLPTAVLKAANLDREKAHGFLMATYTSDGIALDAWPAIGATREWRADPDLLRHIVEVGA